MNMNRPHSSSIRRSASPENHRHDQGHHRSSRHPERREKRPDSRSSSRSERSRRRDDLRHPKRSHQNDLSQSRSHSDRGRESLHRSRRDRDLSPQRHRDRASERAHTHSSNSAKERRPKRSHSHSHSQSQKQSHSHSRHGRRCESRRHHRHHRHHRSPSPSSLRSSLSGSESGSGSDSSPEVGPAPLPLGISSQPTRPSLLSAGPNTSHPRLRGPLPEELEELAPRASGREARWAERRAQNAANRAFSEKDDGQAEYDDEALGLAGGGGMEEEWTLAQAQQDQELQRVGPRTRMDQGPGRRTTSSAQVGKQRSIGAAVRWRERQEAQQSRFDELRARESSTMDMLRGLARQRFGPG